MIKNLFKQSKVYRYLSVCFLSVFLITSFFPIGTLVLEPFHLGMFLIPPSPVYVEHVSLLELSQGLAKDGSYVVAQPLSWMILFGALILLFLILHSFKRYIHFVEFMFHLILALLLFLILRLLPNHLSDSSWQSIQLIEHTWIYHFQSVLLLLTIFLIISGGIIHFFFGDGIEKNHFEEVLSLKKDLHDWKI